MYITKRVYHALKMVVMSLKGTAQMSVPRPWDSTAQRRHLVSCVARISIYVGILKVTADVLDHPSVVNATQPICKNRRTLVSLHLAIISKPEATDFELTKDRPTIKSSHQTGTFAFSLAMTRSRTQTAAIAVKAMRTGT